jgi:hypothetical protein
MMRKWIGGIATSIAATATLTWAWGSLVSSFNSPGTYPDGLGYLDGDLYIAGPSTLYRTTTNGSLLGSWNSPNRWNTGLTAGKIGGTGYIWVGAGPLTGPDNIYRAIATTGSICGSFLEPTKHPWGLALRDETSLFITHINPDLLLLVHPVSGSVYSSYNLGFGPMDVAYDPAGYLWVSNDYPHFVWKCTTTGSPLASFTTDPYGRAGGCAFDGKYLWVGVTGGEHPNLHYLIMQYEVDNETAVTPASLGKVKALYR